MASNRGGLSDPNILRTDSDSKDQCLVGFANVKSRNITEWTPEIENGFARDRCKLVWSLENTKAKAVQKQRQYGKLAINLDRLFLTNHNFCNGLILKVVKLNSDLFERTHDRGETWMTQNISQEAPSRAYPVSPAHMWSFLSIVIIISTPDYQKVVSSIFGQIELRDVYGHSDLSASVAVHIMPQYPPQVPFFPFSARVVSYMPRFCNSQKVVSKPVFCEKVVSTVDSTS